MTYEPVVKTVKVPISPTAAFELFTAGIARWWPLETHSVEGDDAATCVFEAGVGGRIYEKAGDGTEHEWGRVLEWDPPARVLFSWYPSRDDSTAQKVEVTFLPVGTGTKVELVHSGWETLGEAAAAKRADYDTGWDLTLARFVGFVAT